MKTKYALTTLCLFGAWACSSKKKTPEVVPSVESVAVGGPVGDQPADSEKDLAPKALSWTYADPSKWLELSPDYVMCGKGLEQSPVDLKWSKPVAARHISFFFVPGVFQVESHPQKLQITFGKGSHTMIDGTKWNLVAMQVHTPAEHSFSKKIFPLEVHLVHYNEEQTRLGVVAVVFKEGKPNLGIEALLSHLPEAKPGRKFVEDYPLNPSIFLPLANTHYAYNGSLTFPPCTEGVSWTVLNTPLEVSTEQLVKLRRVLGPNARPVQKPNHRKPVNYN